MMIKIKKALNFKFCSFADWSVSFTGQHDQCFFFFYQRNGSYICKVKLNHSFCALAPQCPPCCMCTFKSQCYKMFWYSFLVFIHTTYWSGEKGCRYSFSFITAGYNLEVSWITCFSICPHFFPLVFVLGPLEMGCPQVCLGVKVNVGHMYICDQLMQIFNF